MKTLRARPILLLPIAIILVNVIGIAWWLGSPLFLNQTVDEALPFEVPSSAEIAEMSRPELDAVINEAMEGADDMTDEQRTAAEAALAEVASAMPDTMRDDPMPADDIVILAEGEFRGADRAHQGSGFARIVDLAGVPLLRLEEFDVTNGPALHVLLVENPDATNRNEMGDYVDLGPLKGNMGNQNYFIEDGLDWTQYGGVMIYCMPFHVVFSTAPFGG